MRDVAVIVNLSITIYIKSLGKENNKNNLRLQKKIPTTTTVFSEVFRKNECGVNTLIIQ